MENKRKLEEDSYAVGEEYFARLKRLEEKEKKMEQREMECDERQMMLDNREGNLEARMNMVEEFSEEVERKFNEVQEAIDTFNANLLDLRDREDELDLEVQSLKNEKFFHATRVRFERTKLYENVNALKSLYDGYHKPKVAKSLKVMAFHRVLEGFRTGQLYENSFYFAQYEMILPKFRMYFKGKCYLEDGTGGCYVCIDEVKYCESCDGLDEDCFFCHHSVHSHEMIMMSDLFDLKKFKKSWENCIGITIN